MSIWLECVKLILPKRPSYSKIVYIICLINEGNFSFTHTMIFVILKVSAIWRLFDGILFNEIPMGWLVIFKSRSKTFSITCVLFCFEHVLHEKKIHKNAGTTVQVIELNAILPLLVLKDLNVLAVVKWLHISHLVPPHDLQQRFFFSRGATFTFTRVYFKHLALLEPIMRIFSKTLPCSLSSVSSKYIWDSIFLSFENTGW